MNQTRISELRKARGWTQERLAAESGVAARTIQRLEAGKDASLESITMIANALEVPVSELFVSVGERQFEAAVDGLDARQGLQQERRDATAHGFDLLFRGVGVLIVFATTALVLTGLASWFAWLVIPAYWAGGRYLFRSVLRLAVDPWLDRKYPLSRPTRVQRSSPVRPFD